MLAQIDGDMFKKLRRFVRVAKNELFFIFYLGIECRIENVRRNFWNTCKNEEAVHLCVSSRDYYVIWDTFVHLLYWKLLPCNPHHFYSHLTDFQTCWQSYPLLTSISGNRIPFSCWQLHPFLTSVAGIRFSLSSLENQKGQTTSTPLLAITSAAGNYSSVFH